MYKKNVIKQIYHVLEGYLRKIPVLRQNSPRHSAREIFRLSTGIFRKYPSQTWYICSIVHDETLKIHCFLNKWSGSKNHCCIIFTLRHESVMQYQNCRNLFYVKKGCGQMWRKNMCGLIKTRYLLYLFFFSDMLIS